MMLGPRSRPPFALALPQHVPFCKSSESRLPASVWDRLAFARQKLGEVVATAKAAAVCPDCGGVKGGGVDLAVHTGAPAKPALAIPPAQLRRAEPYTTRRCVARWPPPPFLWGVGRLGTG